MRDCNSDMCIGPALFLIALNRYNTVDVFQDQLEAQIGTPRDDITKILKVLKPRFLSVATKYDAHHRRSDRCNGILSDAQTGTRIAIMKRQEGDTRA